MELRAVNGNTLWELVQLRVKPEQEAFVASNTESILEAYAAEKDGGTALPFGLYEQGEPVGFCMLGYDTLDEDDPAIAKGNYCLWRFMVDETRQGQGLGKRALAMILFHIDTLPRGPASCCWVSYVPENAAAKRLYAAFGFTESEETCDGETVALRPILPRVCLQDGELTLRSAGEEDVPPLHKWWNDGAVMAHAGFPNGLGQTMEQTREDVAWTALKRRLFLIEYAATPIGEMGYSLRDGAAEIGIKICESTFQNRGLGPRCLKLLCDYLFYTHAPQAEKITLNTNLNNRRAQHVYEKFGFARQGVCRGVFQDQLGVLQDAVEYTLAKDAYGRRQGQRVTEADADKL